MLSACSSSRKAKTVQLEAITVNAGDDAYRATATMDWDITHTNVSISFNFKEKTADGTAIIDLHPYFYSSDKIVLDAKSMSIKSVKANGKNLKTNYTNDSLTIYLDRKYHRTESQQLEISYVAMPYAKPTGGSKAISDDRGLFFINTDYSIPNKPTQIWTQGETEANSHWVPTFDKPNERFTTQINITVPDSFKTLSNGVFKGSVKDDNSMRTDTWVMDKNIQPYVMMMAVGRYEVVADKSWNGKEVNYYVESEYAPYALDMFRNTPEMIGFFSDVTGAPYPWNKYSQVVVRDYVSGAMENTSATVFGEFINQTSREIKDKDYEDVVSHELFHQWFGDYVTAESWSNLTLNESFATYGEQLWRRHKYGKPSEEKLAYEDFNIYMSQAGKNDEPLTRFHYKGREDMFDRISYQKGATILRYLHGLVGDSAFYKAMNIYLTENALQPAETHNWRMAVEKATGKDWNWFFNQWYFRGGHPVLEVNYDFDDTKKQVKITLAQKQTHLYQLPMKISVVSGAQVFSDNIDMDTRNMTVTYPYHNNTHPAVYVDADNLIVGEIKDNKTPEHWLEHFKNAGQEAFITKVKALKANAGKLENKTIQEIYHLALNDNMEHVRRYAVSYITMQKNNAVQQVFKPTVQKLALQDNSNHVRAAAFDALGKWKIVEAKSDMFQGLNDDSYKVAAAALRGIGILDKDTVYTIAKQLLLTNPKGELAGEVWEAIGKKGNTADTTFIQERKYRVSGDEKTNLANSLSLYMKNTPTDEAFKIALDAATYITSSESISGYRWANGSYLFDVAYFYKDEVANTNTKASLAKANARLNMLLKAINELEAKETNEENKTSYKNYKKDVWEKGK